MIVLICGNNVYIYYFVSTTDVLLVQWDVPYKYFNGLEVN